MSAFQAVNTTTLTVPDSSIPRAGGEMTPTTPRPGLAFPRNKPAEEQRPDDSMLKTPTRVTFGGVTEQEPPHLPAESNASQDDSESASKPTRTEPKRENSTHSVKSEDSQDVEMGENDDDDNQDGSDDDGDQSDSGRPSKKKKGMRFFCTDFPPCQLSFTRSEHLARHIRKHTGERPFQCHCSRRFSRLDNLRQHAQTVHVNEDIPGDSLAATGTRFQRQIRTDRMRPTHRSRASTTSIGGGHSRGHSRNLSTSSIASTASTMSQVSSMGNRDDSYGRRRPLAMAGDPGHARARLSLDTFNPPLMGSPGPTLQTYGSQSPNVGTPQSYANADSPRFRSGLQSPGMANARPLTWAGAPSTPSRRLSVPSGQNPFQGPLGGMSYPPQYLSPVAPSNASTFSQNSSTVASPTSSTFSTDRRDSIGGAESDLRRRTWHPGTYSQLGPRPATSGLGYHQAADAPQPSFTTQPAATQLRLPGIESFDHAPASSLLARRQPSPMQTGPPRTQPLAPPFEPAPTHRPEHRRNNHSLDLSLQRGIHRLDIANTAQPPQPQHWRDPQHSYTSAGARPTTAPHSGFPLQPAPGSQIQSSYAMAPSEAEKHALDASPNSRRAKRQAWYNGPLESSRQSMAAPPQPIGLMQRTSPDDSGSSEGIPTPSGTSVPEYHPAIVQNNGSVDSFHHEHSNDSQQAKNVLVAHPYGATHQRSHSYTAMYSTPPSAAASYPTPYGYHTFGSREPLQPIPQGRQEPPNDMRRLEALVAVATGEQQAARAS